MQENQKLPQHDNKQERNQRSFIEKIETNCVKSGTIFICICAILWSIAIVEARFSFLLFWLEHYLGWGEALYDAILFGVTLFWLGMVFLYCGIRLIRFSQNKET